MFLKARIKLKIESLDEIEEDLVLIDASFETTELGANIILKLQSTAKYASDQDKTESSNSNI